MNEIQENRPNVSEDQTKKTTFGFISSSRSLTKKLFIINILCTILLFYYLFFIFYYNYLLLFLTAFLKAQTYVSKPSSFCLKLTSRYRSLVDVDKDTKRTKENNPVNSYISLFEICNLQENSWNLD